MTNDPDAFDVSLVYIEAAAVLNEFLRTWLKAGASTDAYSQPHRDQ